MLTDLPDFSGPRLRLDTLTRLRWLAIAGQSAAIIFVAFGLKYPTPLNETLGVILLAALVNIGLSLGFSGNHRFGSSVSALLLGFDMLQLSALLYLTGGLENPFALLFLAPVMISAAALEARHTMLLGLLAATLASLLTRFHWPLPWAAGESLVLPEPYVAGIWVSILLGLAFIGVYAWRVAEEARQMSRALAATELVLEREQHLNALDGLAAAAAHQLGTPLGTITLVAKEMEHQVGSDHPLREDIALLRQEAARCRDILAKLASLGNDRGGPLGQHTLGSLIEEVAEPHRNFGIKVKVDLGGEAAEPEGARSPGVIYGLGNFVENAVDFADTEVTIICRWSPTNVSVTIDDDGPGFPPDLLQRLGEPYLSSRRQRDDAKRHEGGGLGLGLFIAKTLLQRSGARVAWGNVPGGRGARVSVHWPRAAFERGLTAFDEGRP